MANGPTTAADVRDAFLEALAGVRAVDLADVLATAPTPGQIEVDSMEAETVIATLEVQWDIEIAQIESMSNTKELTVKSVTDHIGKSALVGSK